MLGAGVVGHWVGPGQRDIPRPTEYIKVDRTTIHEKDGKLSFRFMEPLEEAVYLDQVKLLAVDHPADLDVYPNEYFASNPPYPNFKVVASRNARPPAAAHDEHGHNVLSDLLAHRYFGDFALTQFSGFAKLHSLELDLGEPYHGGPFWLLLHGEVEYYSANSMYAASQAGVESISPYVERPRCQRQMDSRHRRHGLPRRRPAYHDRGPDRKAAARHAAHSHLHQLADLLEQHSDRPNQSGPGVTFVSRQFRSPAPISAFTDSP